MTLYELFKEGNQLWLLVPTLLLVLAILTVIMVLYARTKDINNTLIFIPQLIIAILLFIEGDIFSRKIEKYNYTPDLKIQLWVVVACLIILISFFLITSAYNLKKHIQLITRSSIKEGVDKLPTAIVFARPSGLIELCNQTMYNLCHMICGQDLQNAEVFWRMLREDKSFHGGVRLSDPSNLLIMVDGSRIWKFDRKEKNSDGQPIVEIIANDITELYTMNKKLEDNNRRLYEMSLRMKQYSRDIQRLTRSRELLERKIYTHDELGQLLLASRKYLSEPQGEGVDSELWKRWHINAELMLYESHSFEKENLMDYLKKTADLVGVELTIEGTPPETGLVAEVILAAGCEAVTNLIRHANGKALYVKVAREGNRYKVEMRNDGARPIGEIKEGGGLSALRQKVEAIGGTMDIDTEPEYLISLSIPEKRGDINA